MPQPTLLEGRWLRPDDTNAIVINTDLLADEPDLILGDELVLKFGRRETSWQNRLTTVSIAAQLHIFNQRPGDMAGYSHNVGLSRQFPPRPKRVQTHGASGVGV